LFRTTNILLQRGAHLWPDRGDIRESAGGSEELLATCV
jgi:hypothetical protein